MFKLIGSVLIILSSSSLGYMIGMRYSMRVREIKLLKISLQMLETEIAYSNTPLPEALKIVCKKSKHPINIIFNKAAANLGKKDCVSVGDAFCKSLDDAKGMYSLIDEDIDILRSFGHSLGSSDVDGQIKSFSLIIKELDAQEIKAEEMRKKNENMYKNLGFLAGVAITILLI